MPKPRNLNKRKIRNRILILCEGKKTEPNYFHGLKGDKHRQNNLAALRIKIYDPKKDKDRRKKKNTGKELVKQAKELKDEAEAEKNPYDDIWIVFDKDGYTKHPQTFNQAKTGDIKIAFSGISFEYWFLLHFEYTTKSFSKADDLIRYLKKYMPNYDKSDDNYLILKDKIENAITHAKRVRRHYQIDLDRGMEVYDLNPYTDVDVLVEYLLNL